MLDVKIISFPTFVSFCTFLYLLLPIIFLLRSSLCMHYFINTKYEITIKIKKYIFQFFIILLAIYSMVRGSWRIRYWNIILLNGSALPFFLNWTTSKFTKDKFKLLSLLFYSFYSVIYISVFLVVLFKDIPLILNLIYPFAYPGIVL